MSAHWMRQGRGTVPAGHCSEPAQFVAPGGRFSFSRSSLELLVSKRCEALQRLGFPVPGPHPLNVGCACPQLGGACGSCISYCPCPPPSLWDSFPQTCSSGRSASPLPSALETSSSSLVGFLHFTRRPQHRSPSPFLSPLCLSTVTTRRSYLFTLGR